MNFNKSIIAFLLVALSVPSLARAQDKAEPTYQILKQANDALKGGNLDRAVALFETARKRPDFADTHADDELLFAVGDYYLAQGTRDDQELALDTYNLVPENRQGKIPPFVNARWRAKRAEAFGSQGQFEKARAELAQIRKSDDRRALLMGDLGDATLALQQNQPDAARERLLEVVDAQDPEITPVALFQLGRAYVALKQSDEAVAVFRKLWSNYGETDYVKRAVFLVGQIYLDRGDFLEARKLYEACSVVGALPQARVRPGDELVIKVVDPDYFAKTRDEHLRVTVSVPSGDRELVVLDKNKVNDRLYTGRIRTALAASVAGDSVLQIAGSDVISISYPGQKGEPYQVNIVDDGQVNIDSVEIPAPIPRHLRSIPRAVAPPPPPVPASERPIIPMGTKTGGSLQPGAPIYVQVVDGDLDRDKQPNTINVDVCATRSPQLPEVVRTIKATLTETGPRTGVFTGMVPTTQPAPSIVTSKPDPAKPYSIDIDLYQPHKLKMLKFDAPAAYRVILQSAGVDKTIPVVAGITQVDLANTFARTIRLEFDPFKVRIPDTSKIILTDSDGQQILPTGIEPGAYAKAGILEVDTTEGVMARYIDTLNETPGKAVMRASKILGVHYFDGQFSLASRAADQAAGGGLHPAWRVRTDERQLLALADPDLDLTIRPDSAEVEVFSESGGHCPLTLTETGNSTGLFTNTLPLSTDPADLKTPGKLFLKPGDLIWASYLDEHNMNPGYRSYRYAWWLENRPTAGAFVAQPMVTTAWPYEVVSGPDAEASGDATPRMQPREIGKGRVAISVRDPDAFPDVDQPANVGIAALVSNSTRDITLRPIGGGMASRDLDLVLGDAQTAPAAGAQDPANQANPELDIAGDEILRFSYQDEKVGTNDMQLRRTLSSAELLALEKAPPEKLAEPVFPTIVLHDPQRQIDAQQAEQVKQLKAQLNQRLWAYQAERKMFADRRKLVAAVKPATTQDTSANELARLDAQLALLDARIQRLTALGATPAPPPPLTSQPVVVVDPVAQRAAAIRDGAITPGEAFDVVIQAPDLGLPTLDIHLRSLAGRLIQSLLVPADRQANGSYRARVQTARSGEASSAGVLSLMPDGEVLVDYDSHKPALSAAERFEYLTLASDAKIQLMNSTYSEEITEARMGESIYVQVTDFDQDRSPDLDQICVEATSDGGKRVIAVCSETEAHSGIFRGKFLTGFEKDAKGIDGPDMLRCGFAQSIAVSYHDYLRVSSDSPELKTISIHIAGGTDGTVEGFSRQFSDSKQELRLWFTTGQAAYEIGRQLRASGATARSEEYLREAGDYFRQLLTRFPDDPLAASADYFLGEILALRGDDQGALERFQEIVDRWPKSDFVARSRFKIGQCYEHLGQFDQAADAYVMLTYHHSGDEHVPAAMMRMMYYYAHAAQTPDAVAIADKFVEKFPTHERAGFVAITAGQLLNAGDKPADAVAWYARMEKVFATDDKTMPGLLFFHAAALIGNGDRIPVKGERGDKIRELLNRVQYDYPASMYAETAKVALKELQPK